MKNFSITDSISYCSHKAIQIMFHTVWVVVVDVFEELIHLPKQSDLLDT